MMTNDPKSLYVHIPFCEKICSYCDFAKVYYDNKIADSYIDVLTEQIKSAKLPKLKTIYIGGGTPSSLTPTQLERLLSILTPLLSEEYEFTIEVNPETITEAKIEIFKKYKINRVSIGIQSFNKKMLRILQRNHEKKHIIKCVNLLNKYEINNYSFDLIFGINSQTMRILKKDLKQALKLKPKHLSLYSLILEKNTKLYIDNYQEMNQDKVRKQYDYLYKYLTKRNYQRYEVSNFSLVKHESLHNLVYWQNKPYYAFGIGASSFVNCKRINNSRSLTKYLNKQFDQEIITLTKEDYEFEFIMLRLRLVEGIPLNLFQKLFKIDFTKKYEQPINKLMKQQLVIIENNYFKCTYEGMMLLDYVTIQILDFL